jgi:hypothetical protein
MAEGVAVSSEQHTRILNPCLNLPPGCTVYNGLFDTPVNRYGSPAYRRSGVRMQLSNGLPEHQEEEACQCPLPTLHFCIITLEYERLHCTLVPTSQHLLTPLQIPHTYHCDLCLKI